MGHFVGCHSRDVQPNECDITLLNNVSSLIAAVEADEANICIIIVGSYLIVIIALSSYSMWNKYYNIISV